MREAEPTLQVGGTLNPDEHLYVSRRDVEDRLFELLSRGEYCNLLSSRQVGKSSTVMKVALRLHETGKRVVIIDLAGELGTPRNAEEWYVGLLGRIVSDLDLDVNVDQWWEETGHGTANQKFLRFFREVAGAAAGAPLVLFVDEIDSTLKVDYTDDFFTAIRAMYNERAMIPAYRGVTFCLVGVANPNELIKHARTTAYNVGTNVEIRDFDPAKDDLSQLHAAMSPDLKIGKELVKAVIEWTSGHPYLTILLCQEIVEHGLTDPDAVRAMLRTRFRSYTQVESDVHFQQISRFLGTRVDDRMKALKLYRRILRGDRERDEATPQHIGLKLAGIVKRDADGMLVVRNRIYRNIFNRAWVRGLLPTDWREQLRRVGVALVAVLIATLGVNLYTAVAQKRQLQAQKGELETQTNTLGKQRDELQMQKQQLALQAKTLEEGRNEIRDQRDSLSRISRELESALVSARRATFLARAASVREARERLRVDSLRRVEEARSQQLRFALEDADSLQKLTEIILREGDSLRLVVQDLEQRGRYEEGISVSREMLRLYEGTATQPMRAAVLERMGGLYRHLSNHAAAREAYSRALAIRQPLRDRAAEAATREALGDVLAAQGKYREALDQYDQVLKPSRGASIGASAALHRKRGDMATRLDRFADAIAAYREALSILAPARGTEEQREEILRSLAATASAMRDHDAYRRYTREARLLDARDENPWRVRLMAGAAYESNQGMGLAFVQSGTFTRLNTSTRFELAARAFNPLGDSTLTVSFGPSLVHAPFRQRSLRLSADMLLEYRNSRKIRVVPGVALNTAISSWILDARLSWPAYADRPHFETTLGMSVFDLVNLRSTAASDTTPTNRGLVPLPPPSTR